MIHLRAVQDTMFEVVTRVTAFAMLLAFGAAVHAADASLCRVLDAELQGIYSGGCVNGLAEGAGAAYGIARYQGGFKAGRKHGKGVKVWPSGDRYEGEFVEDLKHGVGTYSWGSGTPWTGEKYTGSYQHDQRNGRGVYEWPDGERYTGTWKEDEVSGPPTARMLGRAHEERERLAAVSKPGLNVCRQMRVGSVVLDWVRGTVTSIDNREAIIRVDEAGQFEHRIQGVAVTKDVAIRDWALMWTPCR